MAHSNRRERPIDAQLNDCRVLRFHGGPVRPDAQAEFALAADDVFLFFGVSVTRGDLSLPRIHQFFTILGFTGEIDQGQAETIEIAQPEISDIPAGLRRQHPMVELKAGEGVTTGAIDGGAFQGKEGEGQELRLP